MVWADAALSQDSIHDYDVATHGSGGTDGTAYKTFQAALDAVLPGGTITVRAGTYAERAETDVCYHIKKALTIAGYTGETAILTYPAGDPPYASEGNIGQIVRINADVTLNNLTIIGTQDEGDSVSDLDISIQIASGTLTIHHCTFQKWGHAGIKGNGFIAYQNWFEDGGLTFLDHHIYTPLGNCSIYCNVFHGASGYAICGYTAPTNILAWGNIIYNCGNPDGGGVIFGGSGHVIVNNTICNNYNWGFHAWPDGANALNNSLIANNIIRDNETMDVKCDAGSHDNTVTHNNVHIVNYPLVWAAVDDVDVDPQFVDATPTAWPEYRLGAESPMIDAGTATDAAYASILDPAQTTTPTPKAQGVARDIGGFTT